MPGTESLEVTIVITDPVVLQEVRAIPEGPAQEAFLRDAVSVGVMAI